MGAADNKRAIYRGFLRLHTTMEKTASEGMRRVGKAALDLVVQAHREHDPGLMHLHEDNTLGYAVARDGVVYDSGKYSVNSEYDPGFASETASDIASTTKGFVAVMLSDMGSSWYRDHMEIGFLFEARDEIRDKINDFFPTTT
jgi:hypothetical protein